MNSLLPEKLKSFEYYVNKLPLYLQNSYGFIEHYRIWYDLLIGDEFSGVLTVSDDILYLMNIFDDKYLSFIRDFPDSGSEDETDYGLYSDILDKLGLLFGVTRKFTCTYIDDSETISEELSLNNQDFLMLIKCQIIKNYCEGTFEQQQEYYSNVGLTTVILTPEEKHASVDIYLIETQSNTYSENVKKMFLSGLLEIKSLGLIYQEFYTQLTGIMRWDSIIANEVWDGGTWAE